MKLVVFLVTMFLFGCSTYDIDIKSIEDNNKSFYKEIYFGSTKTSKLSHIKEIITSRNASSKSTIDEEIETIETFLTEKIEEINPDFYHNFNTKIQSGDHLLIEEALDEGGKMLEKALYSTPELAKELLLGEKIAREVDINQFLKADGTLDVVFLNKYIDENYIDAFCGPTICNLAVYLVFAFSVAVAVNYASVANVYIWVNAWKWTVAPKRNISSTNTSSPISDLQLELLIDEIAIQYRK